MNAKPGGPEPEPAAAAPPDARGPVGGGWSTAVAVLAIEVLLFLLLRLGFGPAVWLVDKVPHLARLLAGSTDHRLVAMALAGGWFVLARVLQAALVLAALARAPLPASLRAAGVAVSVRADAFAAIKVGSRLVALAALLEAGYAWWVPGGDFLYEVVLGGGAAPPTTPQLLVLTVLATSLVGPAAEELFFRGWIQRLLRPALGPWGAIGLGAALFALAHVPYGQTFPVLQLVGGLAFGWLYECTGRLAAPFAVHATANLVITLLPLAYGS